MKKRIWVFSGNKKCFAIVDFEMFPLLNLHRWMLHNEGYAYTRIGGKQTYMHELVCPKTFKQVVDHLNHNRLDNRVKNLLATTNNKNLLRGRNRERKDLGVSQIPNGKWRARVFVTKEKTKKETHLGTFVLKKDAIKARNKYLEEFKNV